jgi:hypothetical protein
MRTNLEDLVNASGIGVGDETESSRAASLDVTHHDAVRDVPETGEVTHERIYQTTESER